MHGVSHEVLPWPRASSLHCHYMKHCHGRELETFLALGGILISLAHLYLAEGRGINVVKGGVNVVKRGVNLSRAIINLSG